MKQVLYIILFTLLGVLLQFLVHALIEIWYIHRLLANFQKYSLGFSWHEWLLVHRGGAIVLFIAGVIFGLWQGSYWWKKIYGIS